MLHTLFSTWIGGIYIGGLIASTLAKNPWGWSGLEGITGKVIACLFWPVWLAVDVIKQFTKKSPIAGVFPLAAFAGGLIIIPMLTGLGAIAFFIAGVKAWKSGTRNYITTYDSDGFPTRIIKDTNDKMPWYRIPQFYFSGALAIATIVIILAINSQA